MIDSVFCHRWDSALRELKTLLGTEHSTAALAKSFAVGWLIAVKVSNYSLLIHKFEKMKITKNEGSTKRQIVERSSRSQFGINAACLKARKRQKRKLSDKIAARSAAAASDRMNDNTNCCDVRTHPNMWKRSACANVQNRKEVATRLDKQIWLGLMLVQWECHTLLYVNLHCCIFIAGFIVHSLHWCSALSQPRTMSHSSISQSEYLHPLWKL